MENIDIKQLMLVGLAGIITALATGKLLRRILLLPFEWISRKTDSKIDDKLVDEARHDLGVDGPTLPEEEVKK